jgi:uncharacterized membrane protein YkvI
VHPSADADELRVVVLAGELRGLFRPRQGAAGTLDLVRGGLLAVIGTILYSTAILIIAVPFLTSLGREDRSLPSTVRPSILTGFLYGGVMGLCALALLATLPMVYDEATPLVMLGIDIAPWLGYVFSLITLLGIYSTAAPMLWTVADQFPIKSRSTYTIVCLALTLVALIGGLKLPFAALVGFVYPSIGYFGLVFFGFLAYRQIQARLVNN